MLVIPSSKPLFYLFASFLAPQHCKRFPAVGIIVSWTGIHFAPCLSQLAPSHFTSVKTSPLIALSKALLWLLALHTPANHSAFSGIYSFFVSGLILFFCSFICLLSVTLPANYGETFMREGIMAASLDHYRIPSPVFNTLLTFYQPLLNEIRLLR